MSEFNLVDVINLLDKAKNGGFKITCRADELVLKINKDKKPDPLLLSEIKENKAHLLEYFRNQQPQVVPHHHPLRVFNRESFGRIPLSFEQERLWFIDQLHGSTNYHIPWVFRLHGRLDSTALELAFREIIRRHEVLRTVIKEENGMGYQQVLPVEGWKMPCYLQEDIPEEEMPLKAFIGGWLHRAFDLSADYMFRVVLIRVKEDEHVLVVVLHHIAFDGWSTGILSHELQELYNTAIHRTMPVLPSVPVQYADYSIWQRKVVSERHFESRLDYWKRQLEGLEPLKLLTDHARPAEPGIGGKVLVRSISRELWNEVTSLSNREKVTPFMTLLTVFKILLHRYSGQDDICVGSPIAGRQYQELEGLIGLFVNTLALRSNLAGDPSFTTLLQQVRETTLSAYEHQDIPVDKVVEVVLKDRQVAGSSLFQVLFVLQNTPDTSVLKLEGITLTEEVYVQTTSKFDITVYVFEGPDGVEMGIEYNTDLFEQATILRMAAHYEQLLRSAVQSPGQPIGSLAMLTAPEQQQLLHGFNHTAHHYNGKATIVSLFDEQAGRTPHATAIELEGATLSYRELQQHSVRLAGRLRRQGVGRGSLVALLVPRSLEMVAGMLGILRAGGAYVPIDVEYPQERIAWMLQDSGSALVVCSKDSREGVLAPAGVQVVEITLAQAGEEDEIQSEQEVRSEDLAYVIYTSGSTGRPKGVMVEHGSVVNYILQFKEYFSIGPQDRVVQQSALVFDTLVEELYPALVTGACVCIVLEGGRDVYKIKELIEHHAVTILSTTPFVIEWLNRELQHTGSLRHIISGGDVLYPSCIDRLAGKLSIVNSYGPSETTVCATYHTIGNWLEASLIGKPVANVQVYVLSAYGNLCPVGVAGEICIAGPGLARGYLNLPALTEQKFIPHPFRKDVKERLYKTGDLGRWRKEGELEYLGRIDDQVKIRGYRIEPGEIEEVMRGSGMVTQAAVVPYGEENGKRLAAYIVSQGMFNKERLLAHLRSKLPEHMVPPTLVLMEVLPLTATGKIDKRALPPPDRHALAEKTYIAPRNALENKLTHIWQELLQVERVGIEDDFFALGGHSLLAMRAVSAIRKELLLEVTIKDFFRYTRIDLLAGYLQTQNGIAKGSSLQRQPYQERIPLSFAQERLWFIDELQGSVQYHIPFVLQLQGDIDREALEYAFQQIVARHEVLRTVIRSDQAGAFQEVQPACNWKLDYTDRNTADPSFQLQEYIEAIIHHPFDLSKDYMLRSHLLQLSQQEYVLVIVMHHIAADGWSVSIVSAELVAFYRSRRHHQAADLPALPVQYSDYSIWQREYLLQEASQKKLAYWKDKLTGISALQLYTDKPRPAVQSTRGTTFDYYIDKGLSKQVVDLSVREGVTLFMTLLTVFKVLLYRYSGQEDICVGTPIAGRTLQELESLVGFFVNMLPLRSRVEANSSFSDLLLQVKETTLDGYEHAEIPFAKMVELAGIERDVSRSPLFQVMLVVQNTPAVTNIALEDVEINDGTFTAVTSHYDLGFYLTQTSAGLHLLIEYNTDLFEQGTIMRMAAHYGQLLRSAVQSPGQSVGSLAMLTAGEQQQLLQDFRGATRPYDSRATIVSLFDEQVSRTPDAIAVELENATLSYQQLQQQSQQVANWLRQQGVRPGTLVPLCLERSLEMIVGIIGILKAGGAYVPVDPSYPAERINWMLEDAEAGIMLCNRTSRNQLHIEKIHLVNIEDVLLEGPYASPAEHVVSAEDLAYVIFTSGSTGKPKGVMVEHRSVVNRLLWGKQYLDVGQDEVILQKTSFTFDVSVWELLGGLMAGSKIIFARPQGHKDGAYLKQLIEEKGITMVHFVPSMIEAFLSELKTGECRSIKKILCSGEVLKLSHVQSCRKMLGHADVYNLYGPTEAAIEVTCWPAKELRPGMTDIPIGRPVFNTSIYILDNRNQLVPVGVAGELCIGGIQVARGYLKQKALTEEKFAADPFCTEATGRMYRSGDLARWLPDGTVEYIGRKDNQVKIRGFRIELGEIETCLHACEMVQQAVVIASKNVKGDKSLLAYVIPRGSFDRQAVVACLKSRLPEYMIPGVIMELQEFPLTGSGKVDKQRLPGVNELKLASAAYSAPRNAVEQKLAAVWEQLLDLERVGITDNFFEIGGHSLLAIQMASKIKYEYALENFPLIEIYKNPVIASLSTFLQELLRGKTKGGESHLLLLQPEGTGTPLFIVPGAYGASEVYYELAQAFGKERPVYGIQMHGVYADEKPFETMEEIVHTNIEWIRQVAPKGPYRLFGHSFGGMVAYEMARVLESEGGKIERLIVADSGAAVKKQDDEDIKNSIIDMIDELAGKFQVSFSPGWKARLLQEQPVKTCEEAWQYIAGFLKGAGVEDYKTAPLKQLFYLKYANMDFEHLPTGKLQQPIIVVKSAHTPWSAYTPALGWENYVPEVNIIEATGDHYTMVKGVHARKLSDDLNSIQ